MPFADITVCIMSYRYGHLVAQAVESVLAQTLQPKQIVVVDDGAGDCDQALKHYEGQVWYVRRPQNFGIVKNFRTALSNVTTPRVLFLGADNYLRPDALERLSASECDIVSSYLAFVGPDAQKASQGLTGITVKDGYPVYELKAPHGSSLYNVELAREVGGYEASGGEKSEEDSVLFKKMINAGATHEVIEEPLLYYRKHAANHQGI